MKLIRDFACRQCEIGPRHFPVFSVQSMIISRLVHTHIAAGWIHQARLNSHPQKKKKKKKNVVSYSFVSIIIKRGGR